MQMKNTGSQACPWMTAFIACFCMCVQMLEEDWQRQQGEELLVQSQLKRVQEDLRRINRDIAKGLKKKLNLEEKIGESTRGHVRVWYPQWWWWWGWFERVCTVAQWDTTTPLWTLLSQ